MRIIIKIKMAIAMLYRKVDEALDPRNSLS